VDIVPFMQYGGRKRSATSAANSLLTGDLATAPTDAATKMVTAAIVYNSAR
jgi:hypothetical protein